MGIKRRHLLAAAPAAALAAAGMSACGNSDGGNGNGSGTVVFRIWDEEQQPGYQKSVNAFMTAHPTIKVKLEMLPFAQYWTKIITESAAGTGADVFWDTVPYFPQLVKQGVIENLDPLIQKDSFDLNQFYPQVTSAYMYQNHHYGIPADFGIASMVYNKDLCDKAGVTLPAELTWAPDGSGTLLPILQKLTVDTNGRHPTDPGFDPKHVKQWGFMAENHDQTQYISWIPENGGSFMTAPFGKFAFDQPAALAALQWQYDLINKWHVAPAPSEGAALDLFNRGQVGLYPAVNALLPYVVGKGTFTVGVTALPSGPKGRVVNVNGLSFALNKHSKNKTAAWELIKWLGSSQSQQIMAGGGYVWPANKSLAQGYLDYWKGKGQNLQPFVDAAAGASVPMPITPVWNAASLAISNAFQTMFQGQTGVKQTVDGLVAQLNQLIDQNG
ncbi:ABC transporter substrate-binding protein [Rugosimonospora africana]|uniref:Sugar ABC transporter substrate-binding lipoprotein UspC n=1 Tax=Rugosimonospora africana TaxID=556532 RepID=A0A8J3VQP8_9ACTN|nr:sugar ABC transporter substrate-binding protein [Rugosimonospora africana]GIH15267.1 sugar ABC transporter substrate-binding lipoprotein UspC [Rugosimonospora africana]